MNHNEKRAAALAEARTIATQAQRSARSLTPDESSRIETLIEESKMHRAAAEAEAARAPYAALLTQATRNEVDLGGSWLAHEIRTLVPGSGSGAAIDPTRFADFVIETLGTSSAFLASGVNQITLGDAEGQSLTIPAITADATTYNLTAGSAITASDPTIAQVVATPQKFAAMIAASNEVLADANPAALASLSRSLVKSVGAAFDLAAFEGSGTAPAITGLKNVSGINEVSMGTNGASLSNLDPFADAFSEIYADGGKPSAIVVGVRSWKALLKLKTLASGANEPLMLAGGTQAGAGAAVPLSIYGVPVFISSQLSTSETQGTASTAQSAYVYDASQVHAVFRNARGAGSLVSVERDSSRLFNQDSSEIRGILRASIAVPQPGAVCRLKGILA